MNSDKVMAAMAAERAEAMADGAVCPICLKAATIAEPLEIVPFATCRHKLRAYRCQCGCSAAAATEVVQYLHGGVWQTAQYRVVCGGVKGPWDYVGAVGFDISDAKEKRSTTEYTEYTEKGTEKRGASEEKRVTTEYTEDTEKKRRSNEVEITCEAVKLAIDNLAEAIRRSMGSER